MKKLGQLLLGTMAVIVFAPLVFGPLILLSGWLYGKVSFNAEDHDREYLQEKRRRGRSEVVQLWYDRQHLDIQARRQCLESPDCDYFKLRPADNFTGGNTHQPKPWKKEIDIKIKTDTTKRVEYGPQSAEPPRKPSTAFSRQMGRMPEKDKTWLRKAGENPTVDYWLGNGFGH